jgi:hypothetical protein
MDALVVPLWAYFNNADCMDALVVPRLKLLQYMNVLLKNKKQKKSMVFIICCLWEHEILILHIQWLISKKSC